jgi:hypothetical protein
MSSPAQSIETTVPSDDPVLRWHERRAAINRENAQHSTGPRTNAGKQRSALNSLRHGLTAASPVLPTEDRAAYEDHRRGLFDEYKAATPTESQLVQELADTSWRLNRIPLLEADALARALAPADAEQEVTFDIVDAHRILATLGLYSSRLSRQFHKTLEQLRDIQEERRRLENRQLRDAAEIPIRHRRKGLPWEPAEDGFVFSMEQIERQARLLAHENPMYYDPRPHSQASAQAAT